MTYRSKVDLWIAAILTAVPVLLIGAGIYSHQNTLLVIAAIMLALYGLLAFPIRYSVDADSLVIRCGMLRTRIPYSEIRSMRPSRSALASQALSLNRIEIKYSQDSVVFISPAERTAFLDDMRIHAPQADILVS